MRSASPEPQDIVSSVLERKLNNREQIVSNLRLFRLNQNLFESVFREIPVAQKRAGSRALAHFAANARSEKSSILTEFITQLDEYEDLKCVDNNEYSVFLQRIKNAKVNFTIHNIPELSDEQEEEVVEYLGRN